MVKLLLAFFFFRSLVAIDDTQGSCNTQSCDSSVGSNTDNTAMLQMDVQSHKDPSNKDVPDADVKREEEHDMSKLDTDEDGFVSAHELHSKVTEGITVPAELESRLKAAFEHADKDGDGKLNDKELSEFITHFAPGDSSALQTKSQAATGKHLGEKCDATWSEQGGCCGGTNKQGGAAAPSPICRMLMHSCTGSGNNVFECSWWNPFCHLMCNSKSFPYQGVKYCGYCGNPMSR